MLWWWKIWLLSTSAFLNTRSYLPSPLEERSFLFSRPLPLIPAPAFSPNSFIYPHTSPFTLHFLIFQLFPRSLWCVFPPSTPPFSSLSPPSSFTLNGTAHSATKQSCLQHHTLANQAGPELSSLQDPLCNIGIPGGTGVERWGWGWLSQEEKTVEDY